MTVDLTQRLRADTSASGAGLRRGLWVSFLDPYGLEVAAASGADWIGVDLQHGNLDVSDIAGLLRVTEPAGLPLLSRMPSHDAGQISKAIDAGVNGIIIPGVDDAAQAEALVQATLTPPLGSRSTGSSRNTLRNSSDQQTPVLLPMIETASGLRNASEILAVNGVDGVFFGPYDLTISAGFPSPSSSQTLAALTHVIALARDAGKTVGFMAGRPELLAIAENADLVAVDTDASALRTGLALLFDGR